MVSQPHYIEEEVDRGLNQRYSGLVISHVIPLFHHACS